MPAHTRRELLKQGAAFAIGAGMTSAFEGAKAPLAQLSYSQVRLAAGPLWRQVRENHELLLSLNEDSLLRPFRLREGLAAPGNELGGWYSTYAFAPGASFGQWVSALARYYAGTGDPATLAKIRRLVKGYAATIDATGKFFVENRFPSYTYDKLVCGLIDAQAFSNDPDAFEILRLTTDAAAAHLPVQAVARQETPMLNREDFTKHCWDESYTLPENLLLAWQRTGHTRYRDLGKRFLYNDEFFYPLSRGENVLPGKHAYSHVNALSSAALAYLMLGDRRHLRAAKNGFSMVEEQSYATGGWGPDEHFFAPGSGTLGQSLTSTHSSFETPCGAYAHFKITRYLLRITHDPHYGDSMERVLYNTVAGAKRIQPDGSAFYYSDYNLKGSKFFHPDKWPCCSGTLPQVAIDYQIGTYFQDARGLYVNLYLPSTVTWQQDGEACVLRQQTEYPYSSQIQFEIEAAPSKVFSVFLRVPQWAGGARLMVNGTRDSQRLEPGTFAEIRRAWKRGERIELDLPLAMRLESVDAQHPDTVALLAGPLVLMALVDSGPARLTHAALLSARRSPEQSHEWAAQGDAGELRLRPFLDIQDQPYSTYVQLTSA